MAAEALLATGFAVDLGYNGSGVEGAGNTSRRLTRSSGTSRQGATAMVSEKTCTIEGCGNSVGPKGARGLCTKHYQMWLKTGDPCGSTAPTVAERFWRKVAKTSTCWDWTAGKDACGYGMFKDASSSDPTTRAHRWAYIDTFGTIPTGLVLDHLCRNPGCVNPEHLEPVTNQENLDRGWGRRIKNGQATSCVNGHEYTDTNTYTNPLGRKVCRACSARSKARYEQRKSA